MNNPLILILKQYKKQKNLSYRKLGPLFKMSHTHLSDILEGRRPITWDFCVKAADVLKVTKIQSFILGKKITREEAQAWANSANKKESR